MAATTLPATADAEESGGLESLERLCSAEPPLYLSPSLELSGHARAASRNLFSALLPFCPKPPVDSLLAEEGFDAEQIWCQIDLLSRPVVSLLRRELKRIEREPPKELPDENGGGVEREKEEEEKVAALEEEDEEEEEEGEEEEEEDEDEEGDEEEEEEEEGDEGEERGVEDRFLKMKEMKEYMEKDEEKEYGNGKSKGRRKEGEDDDEDEDEEDGSEFEVLDDNEDNESDSAENARYEDFFQSKKRRGSEQANCRKENHFSKKVMFRDELGGLEMDDEQKDDEDTGTQDKEFLSTHEKELKKMKSKIEQMEKANLGPKSWTMQGEVTASKRPKNSALEVDLDFEHNMRPAPVITEEVTATLEDLIKKRIVEGLFDDVQKAPPLPSRAPKETKELDENKSKKGLAEIYEEEYAQKTGLVAAPLSVSDQQKKEASILFKKLCVKLDALSHFHFAPKPVIEDMSIEANVPALAMEEIAPLAVSDAAMLAPEEVFKGKGDVKEEAELTKEERKRRRANKKRKFKAETAKKAAKKARPDAVESHSNARELS